MSFRCLDATCAADATLSIARKAPGGRFSHPAVADGTVALAANHVTTIRFAFSAFGRSLLARIARVERRERFHVTLLGTLSGQRRRVYPLYLRRS